MGARASIYVRERSEVGAPGPNGIADMATAEIALFWPQGDKAAARRALALATAEVWRRFEEQINHMKEE